MQYVSYTFKNMYILIYSLYNCKINAKFNCLFYCRKKKKNKERRKLEERGPKVSAEATEAAEKERDEEELKYRDVVEEEPVEGGFQRRYTKAELAYKKQQEKMVRISKLLLRRSN